MIKGGSLLLPEFINTTRPSDYKNAGSRLRMSLYSPLDIHLYDDAGNHTGPKTITIDGETKTILEEGIPNSYYYQFGERKYVGVSRGEHIQMKMDGYDSGTYTLKMEEVEITELGDETIGRYDGDRVPIHDLEFQVPRAIDARRLMTARAMMQEAQEREMQGEKGVLVYIGPPAHCQRIEAYVDRQKVAELESGIEGSVDMREVGKEEEREKAKIYKRTIGINTFCRKYEPMLPSDSYILDKQVREGKYNEATETVSRLLTSGDKKESSLKLKIVRHLLKKVMENSEDETTRSILEELVSTNLSWRKKESRRIR
jgi:hypothetical protein